MKEYVLGFLFNVPRTQVALILKNRPDWQRGSWNGIGGSIESEDGATLNGGSYSAMSREFREETGVAIPEGEWDRFAMMEFEFEQVRVHCYRASAQSIVSVKSATDERVEIHPVHQLPANCLPNVYWLIAMACHQTGEAVICKLP